MKKKVINKEVIQKKINDLGIGVYFIGIGIFLVILMIGWLLYNIFILIAIPRSSAAIGTTHSRNFLSVGTY
jgi:hypothetical protein